MSATIAEPPSFHFCSINKIVDTVSMVAADIGYPHVRTAYLFFYFKVPFNVCIELRNMRCDLKLIL